MSELEAALGFGIISAAVVSLGAVGFTMQLGVTNIFNIAFAACMTVSVYVAYMLHSAEHINIWMALCIAAIVGAVLAVIIERVIYRPFLRRRSRSLFTIVMVSLGLSFVIRYVCQAIVGGTQYSYGLTPSENVKVGGFVFSERELAIVIIAAAIMVGLHALLKYTRMGKSMRAMASNDDLARVCGISTSRVSTVTWAVSGALGGIGGVVYAIDVVTFSTSTTTTLLLLIVAAAIIGGIGQPYGAMLGALLLGIITSIVGIWLPSLENVIAFMVLGVMVLLRPQGLLASDVGKFSVAQ